MKDFDSFEDYLDDLKRNNNLYKMENNKLIIYIMELEKDINKKHKINIMFESVSNLSMNMLFYINNNLSFKTVRIVKKYFLDNIPHVTNVEFENNGFFSVQLTRKYGLDVLDTKMI